MIHQEFRARPRTLDHFEQQQNHAEREQEIGERDRPSLARDHRHLEQHVRKGHAGHQEGDDVVHRERNQKQRETDHRRNAFSIKMSGQNNAAAKHLLRRRHRLAHGLAEITRVQSSRLKERSCLQDSFFFRT